MNAHTVEYYKTREWNKLLVNTTKTMNFNNFGLKKSDKLKPFHSSIYIKFKTSKTSPLTNSGRLIENNNNWTHTSYHLKLTQNKLQT